MTDKELLALYGTDESKAVGETVRLYLPYVRAIVSDKLAAFGREDIEECVSDIFIGFWRSVERVDLSRGSVRAYLCVLAKSTALRRREQLARRQTVESGEFPDGIGSPPSEQERDELFEALSLVGEDDRRLIMMKYYLGMTYREIAAQLSVSENAAKMRTERALARLRKKLGGDDGEL